MADGRRSDYAPGGRPFTGRAMLVTILAFFGVIVAVNGLMAWLAVANFRGVIVESGYVASQDFARDEALLAAQTARGWSVAADAPGGAPRVTLTGPDGRPLTGLAVAATALRPLDRRQDKALALTEAAPGVYAADAALPRGQWRLSVVVDGRGPRHATTHLIEVR